MKKSIIIIIIILKACTLKDNKNVKINYKKINNESLQENLLDEKSKINQEKPTNKNIKIDEIRKEIQIIRLQIKQNEKQIKKYFKKIDEIDIRQIKRDKEKNESKDLIEIIKDQNDQYKIEYFRKKIKDQIFQKKTKLKKIQNNKEKIKEIEKSKKIILKQKNKEKIFEKNQKDLVQKAFEKLRQKREILNEIKKKKNKVIRKVIYNKHLKKLGTEILKNGLNLKFEKNIFFLKKELEYLKEQEQIRINEYKKSKIQYEKRKRLEEQYNNRINAIDKKEDEICDKIDELNTQIKQYEDQIEDLKYDLSSIIQNLEEKKTEKNFFENEKMNLEYSTEKLKHKIKELKRERSQINQSLFSNYSSRKIKESELNNQRNIIAESLNYESLNEAIKRKKNQEEKFTYEIKELKKEIKNLETKILEIKEAIRDKHYEIQDIKFNIDEIKDSIQEIKTEYQIEIEKNKKEIRNKNDLVEKYLQEIDKKNLRIDYLKTKVYHLYSYGITKNNIKNKLISIHNKKSEIQKQLLEYQNNLENKSFEANNEFERQAKNYRIKLFNQFINEHLREYNNIINENKDFVDMNQNKKIYQLDLELKDDAVRSKYRYIYPDIHIDLPWPNYFYTIEEKKDYDLQKEFFEPLEIYKDKFIESKIQDYLNKFQKLEEQLDNLGALEDKLKMDLDTAIKNFNNEEKKKNEDENSIKENKYEIENIREKIIKLELDINSIYFDIGDIENEKKQEIQKANDEILCKKKEIKKILDVIEYNTNSMHLFNNDNFKKNDELTKIEKKKQDLNSELKHLIETKNKIDSLEKEIFDIENEDFFLNDEKDRLSGQIKINEKLIRANIEKLNRIKIPKYLINEINYLEKKVDKINKKINNQKNCKQSLLNKKKIRTNTLSINEREKNNLINNLNNFEKDNRSYYLLQKQIENISYHIKEKNKEIDLIRDKQIEFIETKKREIEEIEKRVSELERSKDGFKEEIDRREHFYKKIYEEYEEEKKKLKNIQNNIQKIQEYIKIKEKDIKKINEDIDGYQKQINQNLKEIDNYEKNIKEEKKN